MTGLDWRIDSQRTGIGSGRRNVGGEEEDWGNFGGEDEWIGSSGVRTSGLGGGPLRVPRGVDRGGGRKITSVDRCGARRSLILGKLLEPDVHSLADGGSSSILA